jgi:hypothetical protein
MKRLFHPSHPILFRALQTESALHQNVNHILRSFAIEHIGLLSYLDLHESAIEQSSLSHRLTGGRLSALLSETVVLWAMNLFSAQLRYDHKFPIELSSPTFQNCF